MKETLKNLYLSGFVDEVKEFHFQDYYYFVDQNNHIFGILKNNITDNEFKLISTQFDVFYQEERLDSHSKWLDFLFGQMDQIPCQKLNYYFIKFFQITDEETTGSLLQLLKESFPPTSYVVKRQDVFIILTDRDFEDDFHSLLQSIEADFYLNLVGYKSQLSTVSKDLSIRFQMDFNNFKTFSQTNHLLISQVQLIMTQILTPIDFEMKRMIKQYVLQETLNDSEMIQVIKAYFESNLNTTLTAKSCYMHRNTLLNKLDRFIEMSHFNIRQYEDAFMVYLAILL